MRRLLSRLVSVFLRVMSETPFAAVPDPHGQFPGLPLSWYVRPGTVDIPAPRTAPRE